MTTLRDIDIWNVIIDGMTNLSTVNTPERHAINNGNLFQIDYTTDLGDSESGDVLVITPNSTSWCHLTYDLQTEAEAHFYIYENPTTTDNGTLISAFNKDRNSSTTDTTFFYDTPTGVVSTDLSAISDTYTCACTRIDQNNFGEWILKQNEEYLFRVTNATTDSNHVSLRFIWTEHANLAD